MMWSLLFFFNFSSYHLTLSGIYKFLWTAYTITDTIGGFSINCGERNAFSKENTRQNIDKGAESEKHPVRAYRGIILQ